MADSRTSEIKAKIKFSELFKGLYPDHYRVEGNSRCPFHDDTTESFQVESDHGYCHAGCPPPGKGKAWDVMSLWRAYHQCDFKTAVKGLAEKCGIGNGSQSKLKKPGKIVKTYPYHDENGTVLYEVCRYSPKAFRQRRPDPNKPGQWIWKMGTTRRVFYRLPEVLQADTVWICEGEKDADNLVTLGLCGTTPPQGADEKGSKWPGLVKKYAIHEPLDGKTVYILPDNDGPGREHAEAIAQKLSEFATEVKIINFPGLPEKGDVSDFIEQQGPEEAKRMLLELADSSPEYVPSAKTMQQDSNHRDDEERERNKFRRLRTVFNTIGAEPFLNQHGEGYVSVVQSGVARNIAVESSEFHRLLLKLYADAYDEGVSEQTRKQFGEWIEAQATERRELHVRFAQSEGQIVIDTGDDQWTTIVVNPEGWTLVRPERSIFRRFGHMLPLPKPDPEGDVRELLPFLNLKDEQGQMLVLTWVVSSPIASIPRPILTLHGSQGAAKSMATEFIKTVTNPSSVPHHKLSKDSENLLQMMDHHAIVALDNLRSLPDWASDDLCRTVTGSGSQKRAHYTNDDDVIYQFRRAVILNGINIPGLSPDLLDRSLLVEVDRVPDEERLTEEEVRPAFMKVHPRILGGLLNVLSKAMAIKPQIKLSKKPRMADFTLWGCAIAEALGMGQEAFLRAYYSVINFQHEEIVNSEPVCQVVTAFMKNRTDPRYEAQPSDLYEELSKIAAARDLNKNNLWPKTSYAFTRRLKRFAHNLSQMGVDVRFDRNAQSRKVIIERKKTERPTEEASLASCRHGAKDIGRLSVTPHMTQSMMPSINSVTNAVTSNQAQSRDNDGSDGNDAISGVSSLMPLEYESRLELRGCPSCVGFQRTEEFVHCNIHEPPMDLTSPDVQCPRAYAGRQETQDTFPFWEGRS